MTFLRIARVLILKRPRLSMIRVIFEIIHRCICMIRFWMQPSQLIMHLTLSMTTLLTRQIYTHTNTWILRILKINILTIQNLRYSTDFLFNVLKNCNLYLPKLLVLWFWCGCIIRAVNENHFTSHHLHPSSSWSKQALQYYLMPVLKRNIDLPHATFHKDPENCTKP